MIQHARRSIATVCLCNESSTLHPEPLLHSCGSTRFQKSSEGFAGRPALTEQTQPMATCDEYQLAYEMQLHGATPSISIEDITTHVTSCTSCTAYIAATRKAETMNTTTWLHHEQIDPELIRSRMNKEMTRERVLLWSLLPQFAVVGALAVWAGLSAEQLVLVAVTVMVAVAINIKRYFASAEVVADSQGDLIAARRTQLDRRLARTRRVWLLPLMPLLFVLPPLTSRGPIAVAEMMQPLFFIATAGMWVVAVFALLQRRRDQRERNELRD